MACSDQISTQDLINAKLDATTIGEVATSRAGAESTGEKIDTSTSRFAETTDTVIGRLKKMGYAVPVTYASGLVFSEGDNIKTVDEAGIVYAPLPSSLPFTTSGTFTGDDDSRFFTIQSTTSGVIPYDVLSDFINESDPLAIPIGAKLFISEREAGWGGAAHWDVVAPGDATANDINVIENLSTGRKAVLPLGGVLNVRTLGVIPDFRDVTLAMQKALDKWTNIYIPAGALISKGLVLTQPVSIHGDGKTVSRLDFKTGEVGTLLDCLNFKVTLKDFGLFGGLTSTQKANETVSAERNGLSLATQIDSLVDGLTINGFAHQGLTGNDTANGLWERFHVSNTTLKNNHTGLNTGTFGEYTTYSNVQSISNYIGVAMRPGNVISSNCHVDKNGIGLFIDGVPANDGHGNITGFTLNHNTYPILARNIDNGYNIMGNQIFEGIIKLENCVGVMIHGGIINVNEFELIGTGVNYIMHNQMFAGYGNVINRSVSNGTLIIDNYFPDGSYLENTTSRSILIQEDNARVDLNGINTYPRFIMRAPSLTSTELYFEQLADGLHFDNNNATRDYYFDTGSVSVAKVDSGTGDFESLSIGGGMVARSPDGTRYRSTPPNGGGAATWVAV